MKIPDIENAVRKQVTFKKEEHLFDKREIRADCSIDTGIIIICGLCDIYIPGASDKVTKYYDMNAKVYKKYTSLYFAHLKRVAEIIESYGISLKDKDFYKRFTEIFWDKHNKETAGEKLKSGIILSHILSSRREFRTFTEKNESKLTPDDYTSFFIYNKSQLAKNYLGLYNHREVFIDLVDMKY